MTILELELKAKEKTLEATSFGNGEIEIDIQEDRPGWNDGGAGIQCSIVLTSEQAQELLDFLKSQFETNW